jgi:hypothetical protein
LAEPGFPLHLPALPSAIEILTPRLLTLQPGLAFRSTFLLCRAPFKIFTIGL